MRKAIDLNPENAQALNYLGYTYAEQGTHLDEAEKLIKRALDIEPEDGFYLSTVSAGSIIRRSRIGQAADNSRRRST